MKKAIALVLAVAVCLALAGCKSKAVRNTESLIEAIGEVTLKSEAAIVAAEEAYHALSAEDQAEVENYEILASARTTFDGFFETVEITLDNWQEYFEFRDFGEWDEGAFDDVQLVGMHTCLCVKDAYADRIVWDDFEVAVQITQSRYPHSFLVDFSRKTITRIPDTENEPAEVYTDSYTPEECREQFNPSDENHAFVNLGGWNYNASNAEGDTWSGTWPGFVQEVAQIKGTIKIIIL